MSLRCTSSTVTQNHRRAPSPHKVWESGPTLGRGVGPAPQAVAAKGRLAEPWGPKGRAPGRGASLNNSCPNPPHPPYSTPRSSPSAIPERDPMSAPHKPLLHLDDPIAPPRWALLERHLLDMQAQACRTRARPGAIRSRQPSCDSASARVLRSRQYRTGRRFGSTTTPLSRLRPRSRTHVTEVGDDEHATLSLSRGDRMQSGMADRPRRGGNSATVELECGPVPTDITGHEDHGPAR